MPDEFLDEAIRSINQEEYLRACAEALVALASIVFDALYADDSVGPIDYERHSRVDRC